jgi:hypothetical protein
MQQRQFTRKPLFIPALMMVQGRPAIQVRTMDISIGGIGIESAVAIDKGALCMVGFAFPTGRGGLRIPMEFRANVAYSVFKGTLGVQLGLRFLEPSEAFIKVIDDYVSGREVVV